jgi:cytidylate kinase
MIIAIDGPASSGKSTIARLLAKSLDFAYVNSGNLYRAITYRALRMGVDLAAPTQLLECARGAAIELREGELLLDGTAVGGELRSAQVDAQVAQVSALPELREIVNAQVRKIASDRDSVVEGRDMTTVVFPDADAKFYLDASSAARARRRYEQGTSGATFDDIRRNIEMRDEIDRKKSVGSLKIAPDAFYLDSSHLTIQEVYDKVYGTILHLRDPYGR